MFWKIGHRGAAGYEPENTLRSFEKAIALGVDMIELDIHRTKDGRLVVIHDETVDRTTSGTGKVSDMTLAEILELDAGLGEKIPTLESAIDAVRGRVPLDIEVKDAGLSEALGGLFAKKISAGAEAEDFIVSSFMPGELSERDYPSGVRRILLVDKEPLAGIETAADLKCWGIGPRAETVDEDLLAKAHATGLKVVPWTADDAPLIKRLEKLGVDGIFSNFPDRL